MAGLNHLHKPSNKFVIGVIIIITFFTINTCLFENNEDNSENYSPSRKVLRRKIENVKPLVENHISNGQPLPIDRKLFQVETSLNEKQSDLKLQRIKRTSENMSENLLRQFTHTDRAALMKISEKTQVGLNKNGTNDPMESVTTLDAQNEQLNRNIQIFREKLFQKYNEKLREFIKKINFITKLRKTFNTNRDVEFPFSYGIENAKFCVEKSNLTVINILFSKPNDFGVRQHIRSLWGNKRWSKITGLYVVHILGMPETPEENELIQRENEIYNDIIQVNFKDSYVNLTLKTLSMLHWAHHFCPNAEWIMKSDTDAFINSFQLIRFVRENVSEISTPENDKVQIICHLVKRERQALRNDSMIGSKVKDSWIVNYEEYPFRYYPTYCAGHGYLMPKVVASNVYKAADKLNPYRIEDAYFTGILPATIYNHIEYLTTKDSDDDPMMVIPRRETLWKSALAKESHSVEAKN